MDKRWLKQLAGSVYVRGQWHSEHGHDANIAARTKFQEAMQTIYAQAQEAVEIFNTHASAAKQIRLYTVSPAPGEPPCGFMLLMAKVQVKFIQVGTNFESFAVHPEAYQTRQKRLTTFKPVKDAFGDVSWVTDRRERLALEGIVPLLLEDLCRTAYETGCLAW